MRKILSAACLALTLAGCGDRAQELYDTAQLEERQYNEEHAQKLYREILEKFPDSPYAAQARERLSALDAP